MLGWGVVISTLSPNELDSADQETRCAAILAQWETGPEGIRWIDQLAKAGKAMKLSEGGYPNRYTVLAGDVLPMIENDDIRPSQTSPWIFGIDEGAEYVQPSGWMGKINVYPDRIALCSADLVLTIDAWDLS